MIYHFQGDTFSAAVSSVGAELISYQWKGRPLLWEGNPDYWPGHASLLFPIVGELANGEVLFDGHPYSMPRHGIVRKREWLLVEQSDRHITLELCASEDTLQHYPYDFKLRCTHTFGQNGFETRVQVFNHGQRPMPFCLGGHPGFQCPMAEGEAFEDYDIIFDHKETLTTPRLKNGVICPAMTEEVLREEQVLPLTYRLFDKDALILTTLTSRALTLQNRITGKGLRFCFDGFPALGIWSPPGLTAPFVCLEPWQGHAAVEGESGRFEDKPFALTLLPGTSHTAAYQVTLL